MKFRRYLDKIQTKFSQNLEEIRTDIKIKFRQNLDVSKIIQMFLDKIQTKFRQNLDEFRHGLSEKFRQNLDKIQT